MVILLKKAYGVFVTQKLNQKEERIDENC